MENYKGYIDQKERLRKEALSSQDAYMYAVLCSDLGVEPEDDELHQRGIVECFNRSKRLDNLIADLNDKNNRVRYKTFLGEVSARGVYVTDYRKQIELKQDLILKYFGGRFGKEGSQSLSRYSAEQKGALFEKLVRYARRVK